MTRLSTAKLAERQRQIAGGWRSDDCNPYRHEDAMDRLLGRDGADIGRSLGLAPRTVNQWRERYNADHRGPGRVLSVAVGRAVELGRPLDDALAPIDAILEEHGQTRCARIQVERPSLAMVSEHAVRAGREAAEACVAAVEAIQSGDVERYLVEQRQALAAFLEMEQLVRGQAASR